MKPILSGRFRPIFDILLFGTALLAAGIALAGTPQAKPQTISYQPTQDASLLVRVNLGDTDSFPAGQIFFGLYGSADAYNREDALIGRTVAVRGEVVEIPLSDLNPGEYAFRLFHDENSNGELDTGMFGIPSESYYFSNAAEDMFSEPEWAETKFRLSEGEHTYEVRLD